jgi:hypothetical protein
MQAKANTVHLKGGIPTLPGWPFGVVDLPKVRYGDLTVSINRQIHGRSKSVGSAEAAGRSAA